MADPLPPYSNPDPAPSNYSNPPPAQPYPPQQAAYPPQQAAYPPQQAAYPPQQAAYPPQQAAYPPQQQYPPQQPITQQPTTMVQPIDSAILTRQPQQITCPGCSKSVQSKVKYDCGLGACVIGWSVCGVCSFCGMPCFGLAAYCIKDLKDVQHECPSCQRHLGTKKLF